MYLRPFHQKKTTIKLSHFIPVILALIACLMPLGGAAPARAQTNISQIDIVNVDASDFPNVTVQARILDETGQPTSALNPEDFILTEDNTEHSFTVERTQAGVQSALIADLGAGSWGPGATGEPRIEEIQSLMTQYVEAMGPNDRAMIIQQNELGLTVLQAMTPDQNTLLRAIDMLSANRTAEKLSNSYGVVNQALDELASVQMPGMEQAVVLFTSGIQVAGPVTFDDVQAKQQEVGASISAVLTNSVENPMGYNLLRLTDMAGGQYVYYTPETEPEAITGIVGEQRLQYALTYHSASGVEGERTVTLETRGGGADAPRGVGTYSVSVLPPEVAIDSPEGGERIVRAPADAGQPLDEVEPTEVQVTAFVNWPDDYPREIASARLLVNEQPTGDALTNPTTPFTFTWDVRPLRTEGDNEVELQVRVTDNLGLEATSEPVDMTIVVRIPEPEPVVEVTGCEAPASFGEQVSCFFEDLPVPLPVLVGAGVLLLAALLWVGRGVVLGVVSSIDRTIVGMFRSMTHPVEPPAEVEEETPEAAAYLTIEKGEPGVEGARFPLYEGHITPIGRDAEQSNIVVKDDNGVVVGRKHCEIRHEDDRFNVRDFASTSGTFLNGVRLDQLAIAPLNDGDEIGLGPADDGGIKLRFELVKPHKPGSLKR